MGKSRILKASLGRRIIPRRVHGACGYPPRENMGDPHREVRKIINSKASAIGWEYVSSREGNNHG